MRGWLWAGRVLMAVLLAAMLLGPTRAADVPTYQRRADVMVLVVLDRTVSMSAADGPGGVARLAAAVADVRGLADLLADAPFGLVVWGSRARLAVPFTSDHDAFADALLLTRRERPTDGIGSRIDRPRALLRSVLGRATGADRHVVVVFASDGENTAHGTQRSYADVAPLVDGGLVLGYGTDRGARMPLSETRPAGFVPDTRTGRDAVSRRDAGNLRVVARELGLTYMSRTTQGGLDELAALLTPPASVERATVAGEEDLTWLLALLLLPLVLVELRRAWAGWHEARRARWTR